MAADSTPQSGLQNHIRTHAQDYAKFISVLKWVVVAVAIVAAVVIYIISN